MTAELWSITFVTPFPTGWTPRGARRQAALTALPPVPPPVGATRHLRASRVLWLRRL